MTDTGIKILASIVKFEESAEAPKYTLLDTDDISENLFQVRKWLKAYPAEGEYQLLHEIAKRKGISYYINLYEKFENTPGSEQFLVDLMAAKKTKALRGTFLNEELTKHSQEQAWENIVAALQDTQNTRRKKGAKAGDLGMRLEEFLSTAKAEVMRMLGGTTSGMTFSGMTDDQEEKMKKGAMVSHLEWPLPTLQKTLKGVFERSLNFVAAPQGSYKSRFMAQMAARSVLRGCNISYVTAEMDCEEIMGNILKAIMTDPFQWEGTRWEAISRSLRFETNLDKTLMDEAEFYNYVKSCLKNPRDQVDEQGNPAPWGELHVMDTSVHNTLESVIDALEEYDSKLQQKYNDPDIHLEAAFLDYLGIFGVPKEVSRKSQDEKGEYLAGTCKGRICLGFQNGRGLVVVSAHQVNREGQKRSDAKQDHIRSYDMAGSGWIERYADSCVVLKRNGKNNCSVHTVKSRRSEDLEPMLCTADHGQWRIREDNVGDLFDTAHLSLDASL